MSIEGDNVVRHLINNATGTAAATGRRQMVRFITYDLERQDLCGLRQVNPWNHDQPLTEFEEALVKAARKVESARSRLHDALAGLE
jgi:hypothetical protein